jgi:hypothetical protein
VKWRYMISCRIKAWSTKTEKACKLAPHLASQPPHHMHFIEMWSLHQGIWDFWTTISWSNRIWLGPWWTVKNTGSCRSSIKRTCCSIRNSGTYQMFQADQPCSLNRCSCSAAKLACTIWRKLWRKIWCMLQPVHTMSHDILAVLSDEDDEDDDNTDHHENE